MKQKIILLISCIAMILSTTACGNSDAPTTDVSNMSTKELQQLVIELQSENKKLKFEIQEYESQKQQETWSDDEVISFTTKAMLDKVRSITGVTERDITYGDVKYITEFIWNKEYKDLSSLRYFTSLESLEIRAGEFDDLSQLEHLKNLDKLTSLNLNGCTNIKNLEGLHHSQL